MGSTQLGLRNDVVAWTPTDAGTIVILHMQTSRYLSLNASGSVLWTVLADGCTRDDLIDILTQKYGLSERRAASDADAFVEDIRDRGLLDEPARG